MNADSNNKKDEIKPPPAKRARRVPGARVSKQSESSSSTEDDAAPTALRRSSRRKAVAMKKKASPNRRRSKKKVAPRKSKRTTTSSDGDDGAPNVEGKRVVLLRTGTDNPDEKAKLEAMGAVVLREYDDSVTHLCSSEPRRTLKFIAGMATSKYIVTDKWPSQCVKRKTLDVDESNLKRSFKRLRERETPLFDGYKVYFTKEQAVSLRNAIGTMAQSHGAALMGRIPRKSASR